MNDVADIGLPLLMASAQNQVPLPQNQVAGPLPYARSSVSTAMPAKQTDTVSAKLTPGEYVVPKPVVDKVGADNLEAMTNAATAGSTPIPPTGGLTSGRTPVGQTGQTVDASGHPVLRALAYGPNSEGATAADQRQTHGPLGQLQTGDLAVSPNLLKRYPLRSRVNVVDSNGNIVLPNARVADTSWISTGRPTTDTFEIWNGPSLGKGYHLVPI
jgi:hypothetical protein